ncbi:hypothetical protein [Microbacterium sp. CR_7]|uniref:hypothetical protein n=1 Tax=Microbacterium sp. CR_7 TaxID=3055792 RepID=UPI0035BFF6FF
MLVAQIRPIEKTTVDVIGTTLEDVITQLEAQRQPGFDLVSAPVRMLKGEAKMEATGTFSRVDGIREIEADDMSTLRAKVPDGWRMLSLRRS